MRNLNNEPGICEQAIQEIRKIRQINQAKKRNKKLIFNLVFDEMSIRKKIEFVNGEVLGFVDLGNGITNQTGASQALVFMLVNINGNFKIPIAYYLIVSLMAEEKVTILSEILRYLHENEIDVRSVTFDGAPANITMCEKLGACLKQHDRKNIKSYFEHPCTQKPVYIFYDLCHMLKLVRNNFAKSGIIRDGEDFINWNFIVKLIRLIEFEGLHPAVKIRRRHIHFHNEKMKVNLAAQV